jgi:hypothetical protein
MRRRYVLLALAGGGILAAALLVVFLLCSQPEVLYKVTFLPAPGGLRHSSIIQP